MIAQSIRYVITNLPSIFFLAALLIPTLKGGAARSAMSYLSWLLLIAVGFDMIWAGFFHVFFPHTAAAFIGWQVSPFQFEIGVSDMAAGVMAVVAFGRSLPFKLAVVGYIVLFYIGVAVGHVYQAEIAANFSPGNFGMLLLLTIAKIVLLIWLSVWAWRDYRAPAA